MASTSTIVNRALRAHVSPILREAEFEKIDARNGWRWLDKIVWVVNIRAVGNYFSDVTGWAPGSVGVWLGVFYSFVPTDHPLKVSDRGQPLPAEHLCQMRSHLECAVDQCHHVEGLSNPAERDRKDIWWVEPDGRDAVSVAADIASALIGQRLPWFLAHSDLAATLSEVEAGHDCFVKYDNAALLAREIGDREKLTSYARLADAEARRIGRGLNRRARYGV